MEDNAIKLGVGATAMLAIGLALGSRIGDDATETMEPTASDRAQMAKAIDVQRHAVDPAKYDEVIVPLRAKDPQLVDFLTRETESGATTTTGANLPLGARLTVDPPVWVSEPWLVLDANCTDKPDEDATWCEVTLQNPTAQAGRAVFLVRWFTPDPLVNPEPAADASESAP